MFIIARRSVRNRGNGPDGPRCEGPASTVATSQRSFLGSTAPNREGDAQAFGGHRLSPDCGVPIAPGDWAGIAAWKVKGNHASTSDDNIFGTFSTTC